MVANLLADAHVFGPVHGKRWEGRLPDVDDAIDLEVWEIRKADKKGFEYLVEVSFKKKKRDAAEAGRAALHKLLDGKKWLADQEILKTQLILERYQ